MLQQMASSPILAGSSSSVRFAGVADDHVDLAKVRKRPLYAWPNLADVGRFPMNDPQKIAVLLFEVPQHVGLELNHNLLT